MKKVSQIEDKLITKEKESQEDFYRQLIEAIIFTENVSLKIHRILDETKIYKVLEKEFAKSKLYSMCIFLLTDDCSKLKIAAASEFYRKNEIFEKAFGSQLKQFRIDLNRSKFCSQVVKEEKTLDIEITDLLHEIAAQLQGDLIKKFFGSQTKRVIMTPLYHREKVIGIFNTCSVSLTEQYVPIVKNFAQHVSAAVELAKEQSEHEKIWETLRKSEEKYRGLVENVRKVIVTFDMKGKITSVNKTILEYGFGRYEIVGKNFLKFVTKKYLQKILKDFVRASRGESVEGQVELITPRGIRIVEYRTNPIKMGDKVIGTQAVLGDITKRIMMEDELTYERDLLQALMDNIPDLIYFKDVDSRFTRINRAEASVLGLEDAEEAVGKTDFDFFTPEHAHDAFNDEQKIVKTGQPLIGKVEKIRRADGQFRWVTATKVPIKNTIGQVTGIVGISRDITEQKNLQDELKRYSEQLEEIVKERTKKLKEAERLAAIGETATMVGHDLRNPLQVIIGKLYLARENLNRISCPHKEKQNLEKILTRIEEETKYLNKIVLDLQDYASPSNVELEETNISDVINETLSSLPILDTIKVSVMIPESLQKLMIDPTLMRRVFTNLILNALQAMPSGGELRIEALEKDAALINIHDTGVGIPKDNLSKLFQPLFTTKAKGQGFGLAVCKKLLELQGFEVTVDSEVGKGSTFTIKIPFRR